MSENKKYFYLKLKDTFFDSEEMKILESQKNGLEYQNLYLKLCLLSVKNQGKLAFKDTLPYDLNMLSSILRISIDTLKVGIELLNKLKLIEILDNGIMYLTDIQSLIGHGSTEAERIADYRKRIERNKVTDMLPECTPELKTDIDIDSNIDKDIDEKLIIDYLNLKSNREFRYTKTNIKHITARLNEKFSVEDIKKVIDFKCDQWLNDVKMKEYLRPETLFGTKLESYLQAARAKLPSNIKENGIYKYEEQERL